jgi:hypothetical protein
LRRLLRFLLRPIFYWGIEHFTWETWERLDHPVPYWRFAPGSRHDFRWYFEGRSEVPVASIDQICDWLLACEYARDPEVFNEPDFWQHPHTFEHLRRGDCEDHALWAWRKLGELKIAAELYIGHWRSGPDQEGGTHAWVICTIDGREVLFEATAHSREAMIRNLADARAEYQPYFAVDHAFRTAAFGGYMQFLKSSRASAKLKSTERAA